jgi:hypothetical protein
MTSNTVTFSFTKPALTNLHAADVVLGNRKIEGPVVEKSKTAMTAIIEKYIARLKEQNREHHRLLLLGCSQFTVSFDLPADDKKLGIKIIDGANKWEINVVLTPATAASLDLKSLAQIPATPLPLNPPANPAKNPLILSTAPHLNPTSTIPEPALTADLSPKIIPTPSPANPLANFIYIFFAWIGRLLLNLFSSTNPSTAATEKSPLILTKTSISLASVDIRPLRNEGNTCFINSIFQALMNAPGIKPALIAAHEKKIERQKKEIENFNLLIGNKKPKVGIAQAAVQDLKGYSWFSFLSPNPKPDQDLQFCLINLIESKKTVEASMNASIALNEALKTYGNKAKIISLNMLRGFIANSIDSSRQEDACEFLDKIFEPLVYLLEHPNETTPTVLSSLEDIIFKFGEEKKLSPYISGKDEEEEKRAQELASKKDLSPLPENGLLNRAEYSPILRSEISTTKVSLQTLLNDQFEMHERSEPDELSAYTNNDSRGWYKVSQKRTILEPINASAPEYVTLQLKRFRFNSDGTASKIDTALKLPKDNKITLLVQGQNVTYDIQTLVLHKGISPRGGHYLSFVRKNDAWYEANDSIVRPSVLPPSIGNDVYMVFLKKSV